VQGVVKVYDPSTGFGIILTDGGSEVLLRPGSLRGSVFRTLRQGQRSVFETSTENERDYAHSVRIGSDGY
jgi:cold shock CspA family protein